MRVYINLVHDYNQTRKYTFWITHPTTILFNEFSNHWLFYYFILAFGSKMAGEKSDTFEIVLHTLFIMPDYLPLGKKQMP